MNAAKPIGSTRGLSLLGPSASFLNISPLGADITPCSHAKR